MAKKFTVKDIKSGYVIEVRNGSRYLAIRADQNRFEKVFVSKIDFLLAGCYDADLHFIDAVKTKRSRFDERDIVKIWGLSNEPAFSLWVSDVESRPLLWERPPVKKMTIAEIEKALGYSVDIVEEG